MRTRRFSLAVGAIALTTMFALPGTAFANIGTGAYTIKVKDVPGAQFVPVSGTVRCGIGKRIVGGGAYWHSADRVAPDPNIGGLTASYPMAGAKGWAASGLQSILGNGAGVMRIVALCLPSSAVGTYSVQTTDLELAASAREGASVSCPTGRRAVTGGGYTHLADQGPDTASTYTLLGNAPLETGRGWYAAGFGAFGGRHLSVTALCLPKAAVGTITVRWKEIAASYPSGTQARVGGSVGCGAGRRVISGGAWWKYSTASPEPSLPGGLLSSAPTATGRGWYASGVMESQQPGALHIVAICVTL